MFEHALNTVWTAPPKENPTRPATGRPDWEVWEGFAPLGALPIPLLKYTPLK